LIDECQLFFALGLRGFPHFFANVEQRSFQDAQNFWLTAQPPHLFANLVSRILQIFVVLFFETLFFRIRHRIGFFSTPAPVRRGLQAGPQFLRFNTANNFCQSHSKQPPCKRPAIAYANQRT